MKSNICHIQQSTQCRVVSNQIMTNRPSLHAKQYLYEYIMAKAVSRQSTRLLMSVNYWILNSPYAVHKVIGVQYKDR